MSIQGDVITAPDERLAEPLTLGFIGLAVASFSFAALQLGWIGPAQGHVVALCVFLFTVPLQLLASVAGFVRRELPTATGMGLLAGTWAGVSATTYTSLPGDTSQGLGVFLCGCGAAMLVPACAAVVRPLGAAVMVGAALRFWSTAGYELSGSGGWKHLAGWVGLVVALLGFVVALLIAVGLAPPRRPGSSKMSARAHASSRRGIPDGRG